MKIVDSSLLANVRPEWVFAEADGCVVAVTRQQHHFTRGGSSSSLTIRAWAAAKSPADAIDESERNAANRLEHDHHGLRSSTTQSEIIGRRGATPGSSSSTQCEVQAEIPGYDIDAFGKFSKIALNRSGSALVLISDHAVAGLLLGERSSLRENILELETTGSSSSSSKFISSASAAPGGLQQGGTSSVSQGLQASSSKAILQGKTLLNYAVGRKVRRRVLRVAWHPRSEAHVAVFSVDPAGQTFWELIDLSRKGGPSVEYRRKFSPEEAIVDFSFTATSRDDENNEADAGDALPPGAPWTQYSVLFLSENGSLILQEAPASVMIFPRKLVDGARRGGARLAPFFEASEALDDDVALLRLCDRVPTGSHDEEPTRGDPSSSSTARTGINKEKDKESNNRGEGDMYQAMRKGSLVIKYEEEALGVGQSPLLPPSGAAAGKRTFGISPKVLDYNQPYDHQEEEASSAAAVSRTYQSSATITSTSSPEHRAAQRTGTSSANAGFLAYGTYFAKRQQVLRGSVLQNNSYGAYFSQVLLVSASPLPVIAVSRGTEVSVLSLTPD
ncbi:unnamed protein product, partial [Amoebophrya sp. A25]|eukprot:GSA25T00018712001.1